MGLAGPKKNTKISADPRNTHWASNTDRFGHRILEQYGWRPGSTLGDTTSAHHAHLTSASHTGVKVMIKDDVLGIGAKKKTEDHECTGLDVFQDLLGRLNGKDEGEVEKGREAREKNRREIIVGERYRMRFVLGEVYQSSDIDKLLKDQRGEVEEEVKLEFREEVTVKMEEEDGVAVKMEALKVEEVSVEEQSDRKKEKSRKRKIKEEDEDEEEEKRKRKKEKKEKKDKKDKKNKDKKEKKEGRGKGSESSGMTTPSNESEESSLSNVKKSKKDKEAKESSKDRKEKKKEKKEKKDKKDKKDKKKRKESKESSSENSSEEEDTPQVAAVAAAARILTGRRAIRHKYIAAKRSAVMDVQALNEIFMIKA